MGHTTVDNIANAVLLFSNPVWSGDASIPSTIVKNITALSSDIAYSADLDSNITILTSKYASTLNGVIQGLLYVPDLPDGDPCRALEPTFVPESAVRQKDLPPVDYNLIALVPWYNASCTKSYMASAATDPIRGFITYVPGAIDYGKPPGVDDRIWDLHDHGAWRDSSKFPVYAVPATAGLSMMAQLGLYSGNVSSVPYGANISTLYSPNAHDYIRIWTAIHIHTPSVLPTIWVFILICIAVLIGFAAFVSCLMHYLQRRRRLSLERLVRTGEVNLEAMNIKRVQVPLVHVEKFPLFTYNYEPKYASPPPSPMAPRFPAQARVRDDSVTQKLGSSTPTTTEEKTLVDPGSTITGFTNITAATDYQPQCTICLESYENRSTIIRELPCGHIYHPDCIDEFLTEVSSLCPQCKASMLPAGYCPPVTNAMVRRERAVRRLRGLVVVDEAEMQEGTSWRANLSRKLYRPSNDRDTVAVRSTPDRKRPPPEARMRMHVLAGPGSVDEEGSVRLPPWKRITRRVFPGFN
ncbi:unnamed protein product [Discula destructiva]